MIRYPAANALVRELQACGYRDNLYMRALAYITDLETDNETYRRTIAVISSIPSSDNRGQEVELCAKAVAAERAKVAELRAGLEKLLLVPDQVRSDLASAHAEICRLQWLDPTAYNWPEWSPQANTLRWLDKIEAEARALLEDAL